MKNIPTSIKKLFNIVPRHTSMLGRWKLEYSKTFTKVDQQNEDHCACNTLRERYLKDDTDKANLNKKEQNKDSTYRTKYMSHYSYFIPFIL